MRPPINPYIAGKALRNPRDFFGRQDTLEWVKRELRNPNTNGLVLFGQRRIGKTSLLLQLQQGLPDDAFLPVYFDLQNQATLPIGEVLADLAVAITFAANLAPPLQTVFDERGHFFRRTFLPQLEKVLGRRLVFLLDEFDVLDQGIEKELQSTTAAKALLPFLRGLMTENPWPAFLFVVGRRAEDLSVDFTATFKVSLAREIWVLDRTNAEKLIRKAESNSTLRFTNKAVQRILTLTNGHPYLTQLLCQRIWEQAYSAEPTTPPLIDMQEVEQAVPDALKSGHQALIWWWDGLSPAEKIYAAALAEITTENMTIPEERVIKVLTDHAARLRTREVELASRDLVKRRVLEEASAREYRFSIELFRRWVQQNKPLREVKDELDQIDPLAEHIFKFGLDFFRRRQWESAYRYFQDALRMNSHHFRARLYLGEALLELGQINKAVPELEQAYELDQEEAKLALIRGLLDQARASYRAGDQERALSVCKRVLEISPNERTARGLQNSIFKYSKKYNSEASSSMAGHAEKGGQSEQPPTLAAPEKKAQQHADKGRWTDAINISKEWISRAADDRSRAYWQTELERYELEKKLASLFTEGVDAMKQKEWQKAQKRFLDVINDRVTYQKNGRRATELLDQAVKESLAEPTFSSPLALFLRPQVAISEQNAPQVVELKKWGKEQVNKMAYSPDGTLLAVATNLGIYLYNVATLEARLLETSKVRGVAFAPDGKILASGGKDGTVRLWRIPPPELGVGGGLLHAFQEDADGVRTVAFAPNGKTLASSADDSSIRLWHVSDGALLQTLKGHRHLVLSVAFAPDGQNKRQDSPLLASGGADNTVRLWRVSDGTLLHTLQGHRALVMSVAFSPDDSVLASGAADQTIRLWDLSDYRERQLLKEHTSTVYSVAFSPDGTLLASGADDNTVRLWRVSDGHLLRTLEGHTASVTHVTFSPDGTRLTSGSYDGTVRLWGIR